MGYLPIPQNPVWLFPVPAYMKKSQNSFLGTARISECLKTCFAVLNFEIGVPPTVTRDDIFRRCSVTTQRCLVKQCVQPLFPHAYMFPGYVKARQWHGSNCDTCGAWCLRKPNTVELYIPVTSSASWLPVIGKQCRCSCI